MGMGRRWAWAAVLVLAGCDSIGMLVDDVDAAFGEWEPADRDELVELIEARVPTLLDTTKTPGAVVVLYEDGVFVYGEDFGVGNADEGGAIAGATAWFQAASISKSVTAWGVAALVDDGEIDWFDPVNPMLTRWNLPDNPDYDEDEITVEQLLRHRGGTSVGGYTGVYVAGDTLPTLEESLAGTPASLDIPVEVVQAPGSYRYSGGGFTMLQLLVEEVTGQDFADYMDERVLGPLGVELSFGMDGVDESQLLAGHSRGETVYPNYLYTELAAAGMFATAPALAEFGSAWMDLGEGVRGRGVLSEETIDTMIAYKIGLFETANGNFPYYYHSGDNLGWATHYAFHPLTGDVIVVLTNGDSGDLVYPEIMEGWGYLQRKKGREG